MSCGEGGEKAGSIVAPADETWPRLVVPARLAPLPVPVPSGAEAAVPSTSCGELRSRERALPLSLSLPCRDSQSSAGHGVCQSEFKQKAKLRVGEARHKHV